MQIRPNTFSIDIRTRTVSCCVLRVWTNKCGRHPDLILWILSRVHMLEGLMTSQSAVSMYSMWHNMEVTSAWMTTSHLKRTGVCVCVCVCVCLCVCVSVWPEWAVVLGDCRVAKCEIKKGVCVLRRWTCNRAMAHRPFITRTHTPTRTHTQRHTHTTSSLTQYQSRYWCQLCLRLMMSL